MCIKLASSREDELFYITPTQPPNLECPKDHLCQTLLYYIEKKAISIGNKGAHVTLMFLSGNHTMPQCDGNKYYNYCTRFLYFSDYLSMVGLDGNIIIHNLYTVFYISQLSIKNIMFYNGQLTMISVSHKQLYIDSIQLIEFVLSIYKTELGEIVKLQAHNSYVSITNSNNMIFTNCTFDEIQWPMAYPTLISQTPAVTIDQSHNITFSDNSRFYKNHNSALISYSSVITLAGSVSFFDNFGTRGGAMILHSSILNFTTGANVSFINNSAQETGGAIHVEPDLTRMPKLKCFYQRDHYCNNTVTLYFRNNSAKIGGDNVYGTSLAYCQYRTYYYGKKCPINTTLLDTRESSVSSDPIYVCICDNEGRPQCTNSSFINMSKNVYPSEKFTLSATIVGADYGITIGNVYANLFLVSSGAAPAPVLEEEYQYSQMINTVSCKELTYSIYTEYTVQHSVIMSLMAQYTNNPRYLADQECRKYGSYSYLIDSKCRYSPIYINVTILPCPLGFLKSPSRCDCYPPLIEKGVQCVITNGTGYFIWNNALWISISEKGIVYTENCPLKYCTIANKMIDLIANPNSQCVFNRAGRLCGSCRKGYSLAIGSSHCIPCPNNNNIALLIFFIIAGVILVFFISILNLTVTQGMINGLIFYANIVWTSQSILLPLYEINNAAIVFLRAFLAWINLDFGIETCFISGLTALGKTWLQFLFPVYIWAIAGIMIITAKYSKTLTKIYGNRAVPLLATLFLLSYMKLLRTVVTIFLFTHLSEIPTGSTLVVWSVDGELDYFGVEHTFLLVVAIAVVIFLWLPYTLSLLFLQQLQKVSNSCWLLKWVNKLSPFYDAHFAPFNSKHRYWFGLILLTRGILLVLFATLHQSIYLLVILIFGMTLLLYMAIMQPFKSTVVLIIQSSSLANLVLLSGFLLYAQKQNKNEQTIQTIAAGISIGVVFIQFCGITLFNVVKLCRYIWSKKSNVSGNNQEMNEVNDDDFLIEYHDSRDIMESHSSH